MLTLAQAFAILSILQAFNVDAPTLAKVHDILIPPVVNVAPVPFTPVQVIQTPVVENAPVYFGSAPVVVSTPPPPPPPAPVEVVKPAPPTPLYVSQCEYANGQLKLSSNKALATISGATLGDAVYQNKYEENAVTPQYRGGYTNQYKTTLSGLVNLTITDTGGLSVTRSLYLGGPEQAAYYCQ